MRNIFYTLILSLLISYTDSTCYAQQICNEGSQEECFIDETSPSIKLEKTGILFDLNKDNFAQPNEFIRYTFTITNDGTEAIISISLEDPLITNITCTPELTDLVLYPNEAITCTGDYYLTQEDIDNYSFTNTATVRGLANETIEVTSTSTFTLPLAANPSAKIKKCGAFIDINQNGYGDIEDRINYSIFYTNTGNVTLTNIVVSDPLLSNLQCEEFESTVVTDDCRLVSDVSEDADQNEEEEDGFIEFPFKGIKNNTTIRCLGSYQLKPEDILRSLVINEATGSADFIKDVKDSIVVNIPPQIIEPTPTPTITPTPTTTVAQTPIPTPTIQANASIECTQFATRDAKIQTDGAAHTLRGLITRSLKAIERRFKSSKVTNFGKRLRVKAQALYLKSWITTNTKLPELVFSCTADATNYCSSLSLVSAKAEYLSTISEFQTLFGKSQSRLRFLLGGNMPKSELRLKRKFDEVAKGAFSLMNSIPDTGIQSGSCQTGLTIKMLN